MGSDSALDKLEKECIKHIIDTVNQDKNSTDADHIRSLTEIKEQEAQKARVTDAEISILSELKLGNLHYEYIENRSDEFLLTNEEGYPSFVASNRTGHCELRGEKLRKVLDKAREKNPAMSVYDAIISASKNPANNPMIVARISAMSSQIINSAEREMFKKAMMLAAHIIYHQLNTGAVYDSGNNDQVEKLYVTYHACREFYSCLERNTTKNKFIDNIKKDTESLVSGDISFTEMRGRCVEHVKSMTKYDKLIDICVTIANLVISLFIGLGANLYLYSTQKRGFFEDPNKKNKKDLADFIKTTSPDNNKKS